MRLGEEKIIRSLISLLILDLRCKIRGPNNDGSWNGSETPTSKIGYRLVNKWNSRNVS